MGNASGRKSQNKLTTHATTWSAAYICLHCIPVGGSAFCFPAIQPMHWLHETHVGTVICHALLNRVLLWFSYTSSVFLRPVLVSELLLWSLEAACQAIFQSQLNTPKFVSYCYWCASTSMKSKPSNTSPLPVTKQAIPGVPPLKTSVLSLWHHAMFQAASVSSTEREMKFQFKEKKRGGRWD